MAQSLGRYRRPTRPPAVRPTISHAWPWGGRWSRCLLTLSQLAFVAIALATTASASDALAEAFEAELKPLLTAKCGQCHGSDTRKGDLELTTLAGLLRGGESGESAVAQQRDSSPLWQAIDSGDMPPADQPQLSRQEVELVGRWIDAAGPSLPTAGAGHAPLSQHDVLPILLLRCTVCHGPRRQDGGLDLRSRDAMLTGGRSGPAMVPGQPEASRLLQRIESQACPPSELLLKFFVQRPPASEVATLRQWIAAGAPELDIAPDVATHQPDRQVSDEDRQHWAFQPLDLNLPNRPTDELIDERLQQVGLERSPPASRDTLIRRVFLDLIGLPPSLEQLQRWRACQADDWYPRMVEELLASPRYGERWGRYWLDLAGYADSEGGVSADPVRAVAWKYRDYVIAAFNQDKPYDRFLLEQLAGDELLDYQRAPRITQQMVDNLVATGFLRMTIDETGSRTMNFVPERLKVIDDALHVIGSGVLGLTLECARCHSHKYDAIPQRDYYRLKAIFQGAYDEHDWLTFKNRYLQIATPEQLQRVAQRNPPLEAEIKKLRSELKRAEADVVLAILAYYHPQQSTADNQETLRALSIADNNRTLPQRILVERLQHAELRAEAERPAGVVIAQRAAAALAEQIEDRQRQLEPAPTIRALWDRGEPSPTYILLRGEHNRPGRLVGPGVPSVLTDGATPFVVTPPFPDVPDKTGRRLAFARWLVDPSHPLTARVLVNRIWFHHFGRGLVPTLENFGVGGEAPTHPELLDSLARQFVLDGWSIKQLQRRIMNSQVYQQSSRISREQQQLDPTNQWLSHMPLRRMDAEALHDALLFVSGRLDSQAGGPPDPVTVDRDGMVSVSATEAGGWRRSIYAQYRRTEIPTMMDTFDYPEMGPNCIARNQSIVSPQSLLLLNNAHVRELAAATAERVDTLVKAQTPAKASSASVTAARIQTAYRLILSRDPQAAELRLGLEALQHWETLWPEYPGGAWETYCHTLLNSGAFLFVD